MKDRIPEWNLKDLYSSLTDPKIATQLNAIAKRVKSFNLKYKNKLARIAKKPEQMLSAIKSYESILQDLVKPLEYAQLVFSVNQLDPKSGAFLQKMKLAYTEYSKQLIFFELELQKLSSKDLKKLISNRLLENYSNYIQRLLDEQKHRLSEVEEKLMADLSITGRSAWTRLYGEEQASQRFDMKLGKKQKTLMATEILDLLMHKDRAVRKSAALSFSRGLKNSARRTIFIFNTLIADKKTQDTYRSYQNSESSRHLANQISPETVKILSTVVTKHYPLTQNYYSYKARLLKIKDFSYFDRLAPVAGYSKQFKYGEAKEIVLSAFYNFSKTFGDLASLYFKNNWISAKTLPGKRSGAYCSFGTPDVHPYVFMNFQGTIRDVFTLAHELGHALHASLMSSTTYLNFNTPLTIAEVASTFAELLVFEELISRTKSKQAIQALYIQKVDSIIATVFRQVSMYRFEQLFHGAVVKHGEQSVDQVNSYWMQTQSEFYGKSVKLDDNYALWWSYIPHFIHTPFYVYAYAFGDLMALSLYKQYKQNPNKFVPAYTQFLSYGDSRSPDQLVKPLNISLNKEKFWQGGMQVFKDYLDCLDR